MTKEIGRAVATGFGKESTKGTPVAPTYWPDLDKKGLHPKIETIKDESARGRIEAVSASDIAKKWSEPDLGGMIHDQSFGLLLLAALGQVSTTADSPEAGVNTHAFTVKNDNDHPALTIVQEDSNIEKCASYAMRNTLSIEAILDGFARFDAAFIAKALVDDTETASRITENRFVPDHMEVKIAADLAGLGAASAIVVKSCKITIEKNTKAHYKLGSKEPEAITNGELRVRGDIELTFEDSTYFDIFEGGTKKAIRLTLENSDVTIGAASHPKIEIDLAQIAMEEWDRSEENGEIVSQTIGFEAEYSVSDGKMVKIDLVNTVASY